MLAYWRETGRFVLFRAKAVILATGGGGKAWRVTSNSWEYTGDGTALAYDAGAELMDIEFTQFHPTGMVWPPSVRGILVTEGVRGDGGILLNNKGERFMFNYIPRASSPPRPRTPWRKPTAGSTATRTRGARPSCSRATWSRARSAPRSRPAAARRTAACSSTSRRGARPTSSSSKLPSMYHQFKELAEVDITKEPMEVGPTLHYFMGGIRVDADTQMSTVPGLFAAGECAGGMHGANRLGGNSLSDLIVFGKLAGDGAAEYVASLAADAAGRRRQGDRRRSARATDILNREQGANPYLLHEKTLQDVMESYVGIVRIKDELEQGVEGARALKTRRREREGARREPVQPGLARGARHALAAGHRGGRRRAPR